MKLLVSLLIPLLAVLSLATQKLTPKEVFYTDLGTPLEEYYPNADRARSVWDIIHYDGKLFIGSGDFDRNAGPVQIMQYDLSKEQWSNSEIVPEEQISRFSLINDQLMAPGIDPREDWDTGNIYLYANGQWETLRTIPGGIHQFDMLQYENGLFVGLGVQYGQYPVVVSYDGGKTFSEVPFYIDENTLYDHYTQPDGAENSVCTRVYDLIAHQNSLFASLTLIHNGEFIQQIYQYTDGCFHYYSDLTRQLDYRRISYDPISAKVQFHGKTYLSTGNLYATQDMIKQEQIPLPADAIVSDLQVIDGILYVLTVTPTKQGDYMSTVWYSVTGETNSFRQLFYFLHPCPAQCFTYSDQAFYFGMGEGLLSDQNPYNGAVLLVSRK